MSRDGDQGEIIQQNLEDVEAAVGGIAGLSACGLADPSSHDSHRSGYIFNVVGGTCYSAYESRGSRGRCEGFYKSRFAEAAWRKVRPGF
jgi:hypothetical protein